MPKQNMNLVTKAHYVTPSGGSKNCFNTFDFESVTPQATPSTPQQVITAFLTSIWTAAVVPAISSAYLPDGVFARDIGKPTNVVVKGSVLQATGTNGSEPLSADTAVFQRFLTPMRGRNYQGSKHWFGVPESGTLGSELTAAQLTLMIAVAAAIQAGFTDAAGNVWYPVVFSASLSNLLLPTPVIVTTPVSSIVTCKTVGTMRRRKEKGVY